MTYSFVNKTLQILALERAKGDRRLRKKCMEILREHDVNRDGTLDRNELRKMMDALQVAAAPTRCGPHARFDLPFQTRALRTDAACEPLSLSLCRLRPARRVANS